MPSKEIVSNRALSGTEVQKLMREDFEKLLEGEGLLSQQMGYGRLGYDIRIRMHMANPFHPESEISISSRRRAVQELDDNPALAAIESPPLADAPDALVSATQVERTIDSPNVERIRIGEPIPVSVKQMDGTVSTQHIQYPKDPDAGDGNVVVRDVTDEALAEWKVKQGTPTAMAEVDNGDPT
jgi:hypothetical protein